MLQRIRISRASMRRVNEDDSDINNVGNTEVNDCEEHDASDRQAERIVLDGDGNVTAITQFDKYVNKGQHLQDLSLYDYVATIKMIRVKKRQASSIRIGVQDIDTGDTIPRRGRRSFKRYSFDNGGCFDDSFAQIVSPLPVIPQIVGAAPPSYPGNKPDETATDETVRIWTSKAKLFVEFYSYMFLPWDHELDPRDPTLPNLKVLPWDGNTSWDNFCTIIKSWD